MQQLKLDLNFNLSPITSAKQIEMKIINSEWIDRWISERHYLGCAPPGSRLRLASFMRAFVLEECYGADQQRDPMNRFKCWSLQECIWMIFVQGIAKADVLVWQLN
jgi:hypothetical protein